ncbi:MAG TPA: glycosyltransferase family 1 protein [Cellulomonas sp.]
MRVVLDVTAVPADLGGVGRYVVEVAREIVAAGGDLAVVARPSQADGLADALPGAEVLLAPAGTERRPARMVWEQTGLPALVRRVRGEVLHSPHYTMPARVDAARVVTLHDATFFSDPGVHSPVKGRFFRAATRRAVRSADALLVPSAATRDEVVRYTHGHVDRFHVAYHGVDPAVFHPVSEAERHRVAQTLGLTGRPYLAFLGTLEPRKNVPALVRGWVRAVGADPRPPALVLAGGAGWDTQVGPAVDAVPAGLTVLRPGYLPLADLAGYLAGAEVVVYPSLGEGFGLPVLEAMACAAPVLTTRMLSLPEVGGEAVAYTGTGEAEIAAALRALLDDPGRCRELGAAAQVRAQSFSWAASAAAHLTAYEAALRSRSAR